MYYTCTILHIRGRISTLPPGRKSTVHEYVHSCMRFIHWIFHMRCVYVCAQSSHYMRNAYRIGYHNHKACMQRWLISPLTELTREGSCSLSRARDVIERLETERWGSPGEARQGSRRALLVGNSTQGGELYFVVLCNVLAILGSPRSAVVEGPMI